RCFNRAIVSPNPHGAPRRIVKAALVWKTKRHGSGRALELLIVLSRCAAGQGIVLALVQPANSSTVIPLLVDLETSSQEKLGCKLFDCELDGVRCVPKPFVPDWSSAGFMFAARE